MHGSWSSVCREQSSEAGHDWHTNVRPGCTHTHHTLTHTHCITAVVDFAAHRQVSRSVRFRHCSRPLLMVHADTPYSPPPLPPLLSSCQNVTLNYFRHILGFGQIRGWTMLDMLHSMFMMPLLDFSNSTVDPYKTSKLSTEKKLKATLNRRQIGGESP